MSERKKNSEFTHIKSVLKGYVRETSKNATGGLMHVIEVWENVIDKTISENSRPDALRNGVLILKVLSPAWSQQILYLKKNLIRMINSGLDAEIVNDIRCRIISHF